MNYGILRCIPRSGLPRMFFQCDHSTRCSSHQLEWRHLPRSRSDSVAAGPRYPPIRRLYLFHVMLWNWWQCLRFAERGGAELPRKKFVIKRRVALSCPLPETQLGRANANHIELFSFVSILFLRLGMIPLLQWFSWGVCSSRRALLYSFF